LYGKKKYPSPFRPPPCGGGGVSSRSTNERVGRRLAKRNETKFFIFVSSRETKSWGDPLHRFALHQSFKVVFALCGAHASNSYFFKKYKVNVES
jgi:hypothetical protein